MQRLRQLRQRVVSIHASAREATMGGPGGVGGVSVSIHASAREATSGAEDAGLAEGFQSTPPHGRRPAMDPPSWAPPMFQSTPPHGRRRLGPRGAFYTTLFQSTPPHGRRPGSAPEQVVELLVSIHASAREATTANLARHLARRFNPRLRTGGDPLEESKVTIPTVSIHASAREATAQRRRL